MISPRRSQSGVTIYVFMEKFEKNISKLAVTPPYLEHWTLFQIDSFQPRILTMLYLAALVVTLTSLVCGQDYKAEHLGLHKLQNPYYNIGPWQTVDVVGTAGGCCLPPEMEAFTGFVLAEVDKGSPMMILVKKK